MIRNALSSVATPRSAAVAAIVALGGTVGCLVGAALVSATRILFAAEPLLASM